MHARTYVVHTHVRIYVLYTYLQARKDGRVDLLAEVSVIGENEAPPRSSQHLGPYVCVYRNEGLCVAETANGLSGAMTAPLCGIDGKQLSGVS